MDVFGPLTELRKQRSDERSYGDQFAAWCADTGHDPMDPDALMAFDDVMTEGLLVGPTTDGGF